MIVDLGTYENKALPNHCGGIPSGMIQPSGILGVGCDVDDVIDPDVLEVEQSPMSNKHSALFKISSQ